jgi:ABC-type transport system involved in multi-copper enzyme maturation permease subunit
MKGTLAVAAREIAERKLLFLGALVAGLLPLGFPLLPVLRGNSRDARSVAVLLLAATIAVAFPLVLGATILVGDIAQKRLGFYFSRPLPAASIWAGKLLGALLISVGCAFLTAAPVIFVEGESAFSSDTGGLGSRGPLVLALPGVLVLFLLAHVVASMARLRSAWIVLDFILAVVFAVAIALSLRSLFLAGVWDLDEMKHPPETIAWWLTAPLIAALLAASYVQVADGRTDARRSHGALSATLWGLMALLALPLAGLAWWVNAATPKDVIAIEGGIQSAPRGSWVVLAGKVRSRGAAGAVFLYDTASGRYVKLHGSGEVAFSADGARAAWFEEKGFFERKRNGALQIASLDSAKPVSIGSDLQTDAWMPFVLSPSGRRFAALEGDKVLSVYDLADPAHPKQLVAVKLPASAVSRRLSFSGESSLRVLPMIFRNDPGATGNAEMLELDIPSKKIQPTGRFDSAVLPRLRASADGSRLIGVRETRLTLRDGRTGALLAVLSEDLENPRLRFLSGGRIAVTGVADGKGILKIFLESERTPSRAIELGPAANVVLGGEIAPGRVAVALNPFRSNDETARKAWKLAVVDVTDGNVDSHFSGLVPADRFSWWFSPILSPADAGSPASKLFLDADGALVRLDPASGKQEILLGRKR